MSKRASSVASFKVMDILQRANELQAEGHDLIHCEVGQPETGAPARVTQAAIDALRGGPANTDDDDCDFIDSSDGDSAPSLRRRPVLGYTDAFGLLSLRECIAAHYGTKYPLLQRGSLSTEESQTISTSRIVVTTGSSGAFLLAFTACFDVGDVVAIASSGYPCYRNILSALGCTLATIPINDDFKLTARELKAEIERRRTQLGKGEASADENVRPIKGLILSSPSNPTGAMLDPGELRDLCELCDECGIQFISDEIYHGISYGKEEATALMYSDNVIVINSFSKYYSMSGWRLGWMIIPEALIQPINSLQQNMFINAPTISQTAALKCWEPDTLEELEQHVAKYKTSRSILLEQLALLPEIDTMNVAPADGGFYIYIDLGENNIAAPNHGSVQMCQALLEEEYVAFTPGIDFEDPNDNLGNRRFRISYAGGVERVRMGMERFRRFWPSWLERVHEAQKQQQEKGGHHHQQES